MPRLRAQLATAERAILKLGAERLTDAVTELSPFSRQKMLTTMWTGLTALQSASLWWVSADMASLSAHTAPTMPEWTPEAVCPSATGLLLFSGGIPIPDRGRVDAVMWRPEEDTIRVHVYRRGEHANPAIARIYTATGLTPDGAVEIDQRTAPTDPLGQILGAVWTLMMQPRVADRRVINTVSGSTGRAPVERDVSIINLRSVAPDRTHETRTAHTGRDYQHRWAVRGHWRQQRCGIGGQDRKPVWVIPHVKGPSGAPMMQGPVHAWRT